MGYLTKLTPNLALVKEMLVKHDMDFLLVITGRERIGKSTLALQIAKDFDPAFTVEDEPYELSTIVQFGRMFPARGDEALGVPAYPNFADDFLVRVRYQLGASQTAPPATAWATAADLLNTLLPTWVDYELVTGDGFQCDGGDDGTSLLDLKTLGV